MNRLFVVPLGIIAAIGFISTASASERRVSGMKVISSTVTSEAAVVGLGKSLVVELTEDALEAFVGNPKTVLMTMRSARRVYLTGLEIGQTSVFFFGNGGRQIGGLDISVSGGGELSPPTLANQAIPSTTIDIYRGAKELTTVFCDSSKCNTPPEKAPKENVTVINSTYTGGPSGTVSGTSTATSSRP